MSDQSERRYVLVYDISDERRLARVHRRVKKDGMALQHSVFDLSLREPRLRRLAGDLRELIDAREDDVRIYGPRLDVPVTWLGVSPFPPGVQFFIIREPKPAHAREGVRASRVRLVAGPSDAKGPGKILIAGPHYARTGPAPPDRTGITQKSGSKATIFLRSELDSAEIYSCCERPHPALRATFSRREKGTHPSAFGRGAGVRASQNGQGLTTTCRQNS